MKLWHRLVLAVCLGATALVLWQSRQVTLLVGMSRVIETNEPAVSARTSVEPDELTKLREATKDLPRLRNEITQLRTLKTEVESARQEHSKLTEAKQSGATLPRATPKGFIGKEQLANAGFATPEDAVQTFFWAMREGDLTMVLRTLSHGSPEKLSIESLPPEERAKAERGFKLDESQKVMARFNDFSVRTREAVTEDAVYLDLGSSRTTNTLRVLLNRINGEWKLHQIPR